MKFEVQLTGAKGAKSYLVELEPQGERIRVLLNGQEVEADVVQVAPNTISVLLGAKSYEIHVTPTIDGKLRLQTGPDEFAVEVQDPRGWRGRKHGPQEAEGRQQVVSPMPGKVIRVLVSAGAEVEAGQGLVVVEAMKMQNEIRSPKKGKVERVQAKEGQNVNAGEILVWVE
jgi:biotin carboxyl carrier protein